MQNKTGQVVNPEPSEAHEQTLKALSEKDREFRAVFDSALDAMLIADDLSNYVDANSAACELFGLSKEELLHSKLTDFIEPGHEHEAQQSWQAFLEQGEQKGVFRLYRRDGTTRELEYTAKAHIIPGRHLSILRDVTTRIQIGERVREQSEVIETVNRIGQMLSAELDLKKLLQALTDAATELTGARFGSFFYNVNNDEGSSYMLYTLSGVPIEHFAHFPMPRATDIFAPTFRGEGSIRLDDVRKDPRYGKNSPYYGIPEGHLPVVSYLAVPVISRSGKVVGGLFFGDPEVGVFTERHERIMEGLAAQAAIAIDNAMLYQEAQAAIGEREEALKVRDELLAREQAARAEAEEANRAKDEFLATVSHELRTPLNAMLGWARMLRSGKLDENMSQRALETIERNARSQAKLIEDILDVSRITSGKLRLNTRTIELAPVIEASMDSVRPAAEAKAIQIVKSLGDERVIVTGDADRLQQVVWNLLSNAVKFTPNGGRVEVKLQRLDNHAQIKVSDTGEGISPEFIRYVFDRFRQADGTSTRAYGGLGLGLAIVRHIVEMHGGTVCAESEGEARGATFTVRLPLSHSRSRPTR
jgi:PAS domain S-box-containing protein